MKLKYFLAWIPGVAIAIANGALRQFVYQSFLNELQAHQLSTLSFIILFGIYVELILPWLRLSSPAEAIRVGLLWLLITIVFEFIFGHFAMDHSWEKLFYDYNILAGRIWILVLIWTAVSPYFFFNWKSTRVS